MSYLKTITKYSSHEHKSDWLATVSLLLGILSIFLWKFSIVAILAIVIGLTAILTKNLKNLKSGIGISLGIIYLVVNIAHGIAERSFANVPPSNVNEITTTEVIARLAGIIQLPNEVPEHVAMVKDEEALRKQDDFYKDVKNGYYVVMYSSMVILYDLQNNKIISWRSSNR